MHEIMRVGLIGEGTRGDLVPLRVLAARLVAMGIEARLISRPDFAAGNPPGVEFRGIGPPIRVFTAGHAKAFRTMGLDFVRASQVYLEECLEVHFGSLPDALEGCDVALGGGMTLGAPSVAELLGIPYRLVAFCPVVFRSEAYAPLFFPAEGAPPWIKRILWAISEGPFAAWVGHSLNRERKRLGLPPIPRRAGPRRVHRAITHLLSPRPLLSADPTLAPLPEAWRDRVDTLPYWMPEASGSLPEKLEQFLQSGPPPVFFGFGSMPDPHPGQTTVLLREVVEALGCRALVSAGWAKLGGEALPPEIARVEDVPHTLLFPRVAGVVHHGGAGTTTAAARAGVPQLVIPHVLDQYYWGHRVHRLGLGPPPLPRRRLDAESLRERVAALLETQWLAENAARMAITLQNDLADRSGDFEPWVRSLSQL